MIPFDYSVAAKRAKAIIALVFIAALVISHTVSPLIMLPFAAYWLAVLIRTRGRTGYG